MVTVQLGSALLCCCAAGEAASGATAPIPVLREMLRSELDAGKKQVSRSVTQRSIAQQRRSEASWTLSWKQTLVSAMAAGPEKNTVCVVLPP